jgi:hypothetical protein
MLFDQHGLWLRNNHLFLHILPYDERRDLIDFTTIWTRRAKLLEANIATRRSARRGTTTIWATRRSTRGTTTIWTTGRSTRRGITTRGTTANRTNAYDCTTKICAIKTFLATRLYRYKFLSILQYVYMDN